MSFFPFINTSYYLQHSRSFFFGFLSFKYKKKKKKAWKYASMLKRYVAFSLLGKSVYHILEWLSNSIISADKKIPRLQADCPMKLYKSHFWLPTMLAYRNPHTWLYCRTPYFFLVGDSASRSFFILWRVSLSSLQHGFMEQFWFVNISSNRLTSVCPFLTAFIQVSATQRGVPG